MSIVVTGAAGFIGSRLAHALACCVESSDELILVDHPLVTEKARNLVGLERFPFLGHWDFLAQFENEPEVYSVIFHLGACSHTTESDWLYLEDNNLHYSQRLWKCCARAGARVIYASSAATYGDGAQGFDDESDLERLKPLNLYARSKHQFDLWVRQQVRTGLPSPAQSVGLKFFNVWGPGEDHKGRMASMAFHAFQQIQANGSVKLFRSYRPDFCDGGQKRDFIYVSDVVRILLELWKRPHISGLFNLGTASAQTYTSFVSAMFHALGMEPNIEYIPMPLDLQGRYQYFTQATMGKMRSFGVPFQLTPLQNAMDQYATFLRC